MVVIHNTTDALLTLRAYHKCKRPSLEGFYGSESLRLPARAKTAFPCGSHLLDVSGYYREVHVMFGELVLLVLRGDHFENYEGKDITIGVSKIFGLSVVFDNNKGCPRLIDSGASSGAYESPALLRLIKLKEKRDRKEK